ncbi:TolC family protein [Acidithiobacillus caldus]|uniref:TolC family protein n=1 Tax=Acidithiobacillus caldus TaxID=33059 RepID=UPI001D02425A|nr:TolC family protein [Acidithiobacillus caldus]
MPPRFDYRRLRSRQIGRDSGITATLAPTAAPGRLRTGGLFVVLLLALGLGGCAHYTALPLAKAPPSDASLHRELAQALPQLPLKTQGIDFAAPLSGEAIAQIAVLLNPDLRALRKEKGLAEAQVFQAGLLPDPQISLAADFPSNGNGQLFTAYNLSLNWSIGSLFTRPLDLRAARANARSVRYDVAWREWLVAGQARLQARSLYYLERQEAIARDAAQLTGKVWRQSEAELARGDLDLATAALRRAAYVDSEDRALALARQVTKAHAQLLQTLGLPPDVHVRLAPPRLRETIPAAEMLDRLALRHRLDLAALRAGYSAQDARLRRAILGQYPGLSIGLTRAADTSNVQTWGPNVSLTLPLFNANRGVIAEAEATRAKLHADYTARLFQTRADIHALVADLQRLRREIQLLREQVPALQAEAQRLDAALNEGNVTLLDYETLRGQALSKSLQLAALEQSFAEQEVALELAVGSPWATWKTP